MARKTGRAKAVTGKQSRILKCIAGLVAVYLVVVVGYYFGQRSMMYFPELPDSNPVPKPATVGLAMQEVKYKTADGLELVAWFAPPKETGGFVVVVYHGNAANIAYRAPMAAEMMQHGYGVMMPEYRGFGGNPGTPTEEGFYADARAAIKWLEEKGYGAKRLIPYGESIGTGVAVQIATEIQPPLLVLQSPFTSFVDLANHYVPVLPAELMLKDRYDSLAKIGKVRSAVLVIHGDSDTVIPLEFAKRFFDAANEPKQFITLPKAGHNDMYQYGAGPRISAWMDKQLKK